MTAHTVDERFTSSTLSPQGRRNWASAAVGVSIIGVDKKSGEPHGRSNRNDLSHFATNMKTPLIYCCAKDGTVICARAVLKPGVVGEVVRADIGD